MCIKKKLLLFCFMLIACLANGQHKISHTIILEDLEKYETVKGINYSVNINRKTINDTLLIVFPDMTMYQICLDADTSYDKPIKSDSEKSAFIRKCKKEQDERFHEIDMTGIPDGRYKAHMYFPDSGKTIGISIYTRDTDCLPLIDTIDDQPVLLHSERMPEFKGGTGELLEYLFENIKLPSADTYMDRIQSRVVITFVIDEKGKVRNPCILKPVYKDRRTLIEEEVLRVVSNIPEWNPGMVGDEKVATRFFLPLHLHINWE